MPKVLSATMAIALAEMSEHGGELVRWQGGFWTYPSCAIRGKSWPTGENIPEWHIATGTVKALLSRGEICVTENHAGGYPIRVKLSEQTAAAMAGVVD